MMIQRKIYGPGFIDTLEAFAKGRRQLGIVTFDQHDGGQTPMPIQILPQGHWARTNDAPSPPRL